MGKFRMSIDFNVLNHLGINLYSNIPAVLSEAVANAYDADATKVNIDIKSDCVIIEDDGSGMTETDINDKYLLVGYQKRSKENRLALVGARGKEHLRCTCGHGDLCRRTLGA